MSDVMGTVADLIMRLSEKEIWRPIPDYPGYYVSSFGRVTGKRVDALKLGVVHGYSTVCLCRNGKATSVRVHKLVAHAFIGAPPFEGAEIAHNDGDRSNNRVDNLRWATKSENQADRKRHGTWRCGSQVHGAKLSESDIPIIRVKISEGLGYQSIADEFGVSKSAICCIAKGKTWKRASGANWSGA